MKLLNKCETHAQYWGQLQARCTFNLYTLLRWNRTLNIRQRFAIYQLFTKKAGRKVFFYHTTCFTPATCNFGLSFWFMKSRHRQIIIIYSSLDIENNCGGLQHDRNWETSVQRGYKLQLLNSKSHASILMRTGPFNQHVNLISLQLYVKYFWQFRTSSTCSAKMRGRQVRNICSSSTEKIIQSIYVSRSQVTDPCRSTLRRRAAILTWKLHHAAPNVLDRSMQPK